MVGKEIIWSILAREELANVLDFYVLQNGNANYSLQLLDDVEDLLNTLSKSEFIGRLAANKITRIIPMDVYLIFYEINCDQIEIVSFWDNRQNQKNRKVK